MSHCDQLTAIGDIVVNNADYPALNRVSRWCALAGLLLAMTLIGHSSAQASSNSSSSETGIEIGILTFLGVDVQVYHRPIGSSLQFGYKYLKTTEVFGFSGTDIDETTTTKTGPFVRYLLNPNQDSTLYLGISLLKHTESVKCLLIVDQDEASDTSPYFGGGMMGWRNKSIYYNIGLYVSPTASLSTQTSCGSTESEALFDVNFNLGLVF